MIEDKDIMKIFEEILNLNETEALLFEEALKNYVIQIQSGEVEIDKKQFMAMNNINEENIAEWVDGVKQEIKEIEEHPSFLPFQKRLLINATLMSLLVIIGEQMPYIEPVYVPIELCHADAVVPKYAKNGDAGMDVYALEDITIGCGETVVVPTGLKCEIPTGYELQVRPRSGITLKTHLRVSNSPGTIDSQYRDEIGILITNTDQRIRDIEFTKDGQIVEGSITYGNSYTITKGMRIAQLVLAETPRCAFTKVEKIDKTLDRKSGFGGTGLY